MKNIIVDDDQTYIFNNGIYISRQGNVLDSSERKIDLIESEDGYLLVPSSNLAIKKAVSKVNDKNGNIAEGVYVHRMVVFSFGDKNGKKYNPSFLIDHIDMNHKNNNVENLELVTDEINLFRAFYKTNSSECKKRFLNKYESLSEIEKFILKEKIKKEINNENFIRK